MPSPMPDLRAVGIVRVSEVGGRSGEGFVSPDLQREHIAQSCEAHGWTLVETMEELDVSGGKPLEDRPGLSKAVQMVEEGDADVVVGAYFDRLFRSLSTQAETIARVEAAGGTVFAVDMGNVSNVTAGEFLKASMFGAFADYFRRLVAEKSGEAQARCVERGVSPGSPVPLGYVKGPDGRFVVDADKAALVREMFRLRAAGASVIEVKEFLRDAGFPRAQSTVNYMLVNRTYLGEIHFGKLYNLDAHEPIIDPELFAAVGRMKVPRGRQTKNPHLLARLGILRCESCGGPMSVNGGKVESYRCSNRHVVEPCPRPVSIQAQIAEAVVVSTVKAVLANVEARSDATEAAWEAQDRAAKSQEALDMALRGFMSSGLLDEPAAVERLTQLREERDRDREAVERIGSGVERRVTVDDWDLMTLDSQRALIQAVIEKAVVAPGDAFSRWTGPEHRITVFRRKAS